MKPKIKKLVALVGADDFKKSVAESLKPFSKRVFGVTDLPMSYVKECLHHDFKQEFTGPLVVNDSHVRHFFSKLKRVRPVQDYVGKVLNSRKEATEFFLNYVGERAFGKEWLVHDLREAFQSETEGVFVVTDLTEDEAHRLKLGLGSSFLVVHVGEEKSDKADLSVKPEKSKAAAKRVTQSILELINPTEYRRNQNERTA